MRLAPQEIARVAHEINRAYCAAIGDASQVAWLEAPEWQRESAYAGVCAHLEQPRTPAELHELWMAQKLADGWTYGTDKDPVAKTHPCLVPFEQLPPEQRIKDSLFAAVVEAFR